MCIVCFGSPKNTLPASHELIQFFEAHATFQCTSIQSKEKEKKKEKNIKKLFSLYTTFFLSTFSCPTANHAPKTSIRYKKKCAPKFYYKSPEIYI